MRLEDIADNDLSGRFWSKVSVCAKDECWPWTAATGSHGKSGLRYGRFALRLVSGKKQTLTAHRVAFLLTQGYVESGKMVLHECDNPPCCNPAHLREGTGTDNASDRQSRERGNKPKKLPLESRQEILRSKVQDDARSIDLAVRFGVAPSTIAHYLREFGYSDSRRLRKLDSFQVREIIRARQECELDYATLARAFGVSDATIGSIVGGKTWKAIAR